MESDDLEKAKTHILIEILEYISGSVVSRSLLKKSNGNISVIAVDTGEVMTEKISPFDTFIQVIEGSAEIIIDNIPQIIQTGQAIIIPAHTRSKLIANNRFKVISTVIKSGYENCVL